MAEKLLVAGAGIAGLGVALAFGGSAYEVTLLDRDPEPPRDSLEEAFYSWERRGATQLRHSHGFLGRLTVLLRDRHPALLEELYANGVRALDFKFGIPPQLRQTYKPQPGDEDLKILFSRRTTMELVLRRHVQRFANVRIIPNAGIRGILTRRQASAIAADGWKVEIDGDLQDMRGDIIVDASGRNSAVPDWLRADGIALEEETAPTGILYFTRHYRLLDGAEEPQRGATPLAADLGYIKYGVFAADNRHFSITLATPEIESDLRTMIMRPEVFEAVCEALPGTARWIEKTRAEPVTAIYAMGNLKSVWRHYLKDREPQILNFFAVGDAAVRTNPLYGRGCSAGMVHAHVLREVLEADNDPRRRAMAFDKRTRETLRPFYDAMVRQDRIAIRRAEHERDANYKPGLRARMAKSFVEDGLVPALRGDMTVLRAFSRGFHMLDNPSNWMKRPEIMATILKFWRMPKAEKAARGYYPPKLGPSRAEMLARLGIAA
jgi:2-polyprenyl-6-methoxyphenol hydroxylase-like FAD-dependent oxidoreductase